MTTTISSQHKSNQYLENFSLIWFDPDPEDVQNAERKLRSIINNIIKFEDLSQCQQFIRQTSPTDNLVVVINSELGRKLIPSIHELQQIISIYIYCTKTESIEQYVSKYSKIERIFSNVDELISKIKYDHRIRKQIKEPLVINIFSSAGQSTTQLNGRFVFFQILIDCLLKIKPNEADKNELMNIYQNAYKQNKTELDILNEFQSTYSSQNVFWWYTRESFFYRTINTALRSENIHMMYLLRSFIFDIQQQLQKYQFKNNINVYRSQIMSKNEIETLKNSVGVLISINSFFSTSQNRALTIHMLGESNSTVDWERILFEIDVDPKMIKTKPFADISKMSYFPNESEILFMSGSL